MFPLQVRTHTGETEKDITSLLTQIGELRSAVSAIETELVARLIAIRARAWTSTSHAFAAACMAGHAEALARLMFGDAALSVTHEPDALATDAPAEEALLAGGSIEDVSSIADAEVPTDAAAIATDSRVASRENVEGTMPLAEEAIAELPASLARSLQDDFTLIRGIDDDAAAVLHSFGLTHFRDIALFEPEDVIIVGRTLGDPRRLSRQCWIEQAALLASGTITAYAAERLHEAAMSAEPVLEKAEAALPGCDAPETPAAEPIAVELAPDAPNVVDLAAFKERRGKVHRPARWAALAAGIAVLAVASAATMNVRLDFANTIERIGCSHSMQSLVSACDQLTWLGE